MGHKKIIVTTGTEHTYTYTDEEQAILGAGMPDFLSPLMLPIPEIEYLSTFMRAMPRPEDPTWHAPLTEPTLVAVSAYVEEEDDEGWIYDIDIYAIICKETEHYYGDEPTKAETDEYLNKALKSINKHIDLFKTDNPPTSLPDVAHIIGVNVTRHRHGDPNVYAVTTPSAENSPEYSAKLYEYYLTFQTGEKPVPDAGAAKNKENTDSIRYIPNVSSASAAIITGVDPAPAYGRMPGYGGEPGPADDTIYSPEIMVNGIRLSYGSSNPLDAIKWQGVNYSSDDTRVKAPHVDEGRMRQGQHRFLISSKLFNAVIEWLRKQDHNMAGKEHLDIVSEKTHGIIFYSADAHNNGETRGGIPDDMVDATDLIALLTAHAGNESGSRVFDAISNDEKAVDFLHKLLDNTLTKGHEGKAKAKLNAIFDEELRREAEQKDKKIKQEKPVKVNVQNDMNNSRDTINWWGTGLPATPKTDTDDWNFHITLPEGKEIGDYPSHMVTGPPSDPDRGSK